MNEHIITPYFRPSRAAINLDALIHNYKTIKKLLPPRVEILAMVKAGAYGHGAVPVAKTLAKCGAAAFGVATVEEGLELRNAGISSQIIVLGGLMGMGSAASGMMVAADLTPVIHSSHVIDFLEAVAASAEKRLPIHLKIDTGMSRLGVRPETLPRVLDRLSQCKWIYVEGVMSHLADADKKFSAQQMKTFMECREIIENALGHIEIWHIANSTAVMKGENVEISESKKCWARPGITLYGSTNGIKLPDGIQLKPVLSLESKVALLKHVPKNTPVSYGCTFITKKPSYLAVIPIGYADGYPLALSNKAKVLIRGQRAPVVGRVTMDMIVVDVTTINDVSVGDTITLIGKQGNDFISIDEIAKLANTIPYEILCGISERVPRVYGKSY